MCDGFSEAALMMAAGGSEGMGAAAGGYTAMAGVGEAVGSVASMAAANVGTIASLGTAGLSGVSAFTQASAAQQANKYQAEVEQNNAQLAAYQRSAAIQQGGLQAQQSLLQTVQVIGEQKATLAANGVDLSSGSALDQLATSRFLGAQDVNALQSNAARAAWGYQVQEQTHQIQSGLSAWQANTNNPLAIAASATGGSLLSNATRYAGQGG
ncbi:hypothetical protein [Methylomonas sp. AM2-LC]|uniref:hypothetical protein n=1 Tax=Methylomonas sp. AM2-LC TaxID=3153301 RepID=UPI003262D271